MEHQLDPSADWIVGLGFKIFVVFIIICLFKAIFDKTLTQKELEEEMTGKEEEPPDPHSECTGHVKICVKARVDE